MFSKSKRFNYDQKRSPSPQQSNCKVHLKRCCSFSPKTHRSDVNKSGVGFLTSTRKSRRDYFEFDNRIMEQGPICERFLRRHSLMKTPSPENPNSRPSSTPRTLSERFPLDFSPKHPVFVTLPMKKCRNTTNLSKIPVTMSAQKEKTRNSHEELTKRIPRSKSYEAIIPQKPPRKSLESKVAITTSIQCSSRQSEASSSSSTSKKTINRFNYNNRRIMSFIESSSSSSDESLHYFEKELHELAEKRFHCVSHEFDLPSSSDEGINLISPLSSHEDFDKIIQNLDHRISDLLSPPSVENHQTPEEEDIVKAENDNETTVTATLKRDEPLEVKLRLLLEHDVKYKLDQVPSACSNVVDNVYLKVMEQLCARMSQIEAENKKLKAEKSGFRKIYRFLRGSRK